MHRALPFLVLVGILLPGCFGGDAPPPPTDGNGSTESPGKGPGTPALLWVRGAAYRFNVTNAQGELTAIRQYTVVGLNSSTGAPCWEVRREETRRTPQGDWVPMVPTSLQYNATSGGICAWTWTKEGNRTITVHFRPHVLPFWPPDTHTGLGDAYWNGTGGTRGQEVDSWAVSHEGRETLRLESGTFQNTEVYKTSLAVTGEALRRETQRIWYSPQVGFFLKRVSLASGETEEFAVNTEDVTGLSPKVGYRQGA
ncbi:MAG TPA: hypothetical protein VNZ52_02950 [Candidatus Thermoplasmatota archaeon]|nr:hypothetical protein [Candidatus Thermoplasmatota archaeon]